MYKAISIVSLAAIALTSCTTENNILDQSPEISGSVVTLEATKWETENITLDFQEGRYLANAGCNGISGNYTIDGAGEITLEGGASTMMFCGDEVMQRENNLKDFLITVDSFDYTGETLILKSWDKTMEFSAAQMASLTDTKWKLNGMLINDGILMDASFENAFVEFSQDGKISGKAMCNNFAGEFSQENQTLEIWALAATKKLCIDENAGKYETAFLADLQNISQYSINRNSLELTNTDSSIRLSFTAE